MKRIALMAITLSLAWPVRADESVGAGRAIFDTRCAGCHRPASPVSRNLGPALTGIIGRRSGSEDTGVHSRAAIETGVMWDRDSLRRYLAAPTRELPGTIMPVRVADPDELEQLLDYLESLR